MRLLLVIGCFVACSGPFSMLVRGESTRIRVTWPVPGGDITPVFVDLPRSLDVDVAVALPDGGTGDRTILPAQRDSVQPNRLWWLARRPEKASVSEYMLVPNGPSSRTSSVVCLTDSNDFTVSISEKPVLVYRHAQLPPPQGKKPLFTRSGFIHPLYSPSGQILTSIHPPDHLHHFGIWNPWTSTEFRGKYVDFWNLGKGQGTVRFSALDAIFEGPVFGGFQARHEHVVFGPDQSETAALSEVWDVRVWNLEDRWLIDFTTIQTCATDSPLKLNAYRYGGFVFRGRSGWHSDNSDYLTSEGKTRADGHGTRARWCHAYGASDQGPAGVLFMSHPQNREHPEPMRLWPAGMNKGRDNMFFNFCPVQKKPWTLEPGKTYTLRYRMCVYDGIPSDVDAEALWQSFANPPRAEIVRQ